MSQSNNFWVRNIKTIFFRIRFYSSSDSFKNEVGFEFERFFLSCWQMMPKFNFNFSHSHIHLWSRISIWGFITCFSIPRTLTHRFSIKPLIYFPKRYLVSLWVSTLKIEPIKLLNSQSSEMKKIYLQKVNYLHQEYLWTSIMLLVDWLSLSSFFANYREENNVKRILSTHGSINIFVEQRKRIKTFSDR